MHSARARIQQTANANEVAHMSLYEYAYTWCGCTECGLVGAAPAARGILMRTADDDDTDYTI